MSRDVVCGMAIDEWSTPHRVHHDGQAYYFCSAACRREFERDPQRYTAAAPVPQR